MSKNELPYFKSAFLNEQLRIGNLSHNSSAGRIMVLESFNFIEVPYDNRHKHRNKISAELRKEGFIYAGNSIGYIKR